MVDEATQCNADTVSATAALISGFTAALSAFEIFLASSITEGCSLNAKCSPALPSSRDLLGPARPDDQPDAHAKPRQHVDQCIGTEQVDATAQEVAYSGLRDPKHFRGLGLLEPSRRDRLLHLNQQVSTNEEVLGFLLENPRSRKTFPVDGVTLTAFFFAMLLPQHP